MSKITESARGEDCLIRIPGVCLHDPETTVFAHANGGGMARKMPDSEGAYSCAACHDAVDRRGVQYCADDIHIKIRMVNGAWSYWRKSDIDIMFFEAQRRTRIKLIEKGLLVLL